MNGAQRIKQIHAEMQLKRTAKIRAFANSLGIRVANAEISLEQALAETREALKNHPAILAHEARN